MERICQIRVNSEFNGIDDEQNETKSAPNQNGMDGWMMIRLIWFQLLWLFFYFLSCRTYFWKLNNKWSVEYVVRKQWNGNNTNIRQTSDCGPTNQSITIYDAHNVWARAREKAVFGPSVSMHLVNGQCCTTNRIDFYQIPNED